MVVQHDLGATYPMNFETKIQNMTTLLYGLQTIRPHNNGPSWPTVIWFPNINR
jgi:hypothetical protein